jgi:DNA-binding MarR family transcriptional regulator
MRTHKSLSPAAQIATGLEARAHASDHAALRGWLRMLSCTRQIETEIRSRLRQRFGITLARFDFLAQLHRHPQGLAMSEISNRLMVTGGNVTGLTDELAIEGLVARKPNPADARGTLVKLTAKGKRSFEAMANEHEQWVVALFSALPPDGQAQLHALLGALRMGMETQSLLKQDLQ